MKKDVIILIVRVAAALLVFIALIAALRGDLAHHYRKHFASERRERLFLASLAFLTTMFALRALTCAIQTTLDRCTMSKPRALICTTWVWGIIGLLAIGYAWLRLETECQANHKPDRP